MGIHLHSMTGDTKQFFKLHALVNSRNQLQVPKGHIAVYAGEIQKKRFVVPIAYLTHPSFAALLKRAEEEFGYNPLQRGCFHRSDFKIE